MDRPGKARPKARINVGESLLFIVLLVLAGYILFRSPLFQVQRMEVTGTRLLQPGQIRELSGINLGENIFQVNLGEAQKKIALLPLVKTADLRRILPSTVLIEVTERTPVALLDEGSTFGEVDEDGYYLQQGAVNTGGLPVLTGIQASLPAPGQKVNAQALPAVLHFVSGLPPDLLPKLSEVHVQSNGQLILTTLYGIPVLAGDTSDPAGKGALLLAILQQLEQKKKIAYIDLSSVSSPVVKYQD
ncbi:MAG TPA: FtsQ-type POTRA domain-containing protein [Spirochaetia bacterium]|nr:FtsQ-type POTRA domain-containing protein [Spirochaetia bacterium]